MRVGVVDIGTNSMRLLITDGEIDLQRLEEVTGLGRGVDSTGLLSEPRIVETVAVLERYGHVMDEAAVGVRKVIATSASRDASNRDSFFDRAEAAIGVRPTLISGEEEARLAYEGAVGGFDGPAPIVVSDIGGGSTEFVTENSGVSVDIGSVRVTERAVPYRPATKGEVEAAREEIKDAFSGLSAFVYGSLIGVAGTWTSLAAVARAIPLGTSVHGRAVSLSEVRTMIDIMAELDLEETAHLPGLAPKRAEVILGGALVAEGVMEALGAESATVSEHDTLDGVARSLLALP
jgi:exopolyphosphatase/guanosine-5'-triphosphate,3'-diphosphate pyrophosphatase